MKPIQIILLALVALFACDSKTKSMTAKGSLTYLALGDSYTIGESVPQNQSFPYQLAGLLNSNSLPVQLPTIIATTGWTTDNLIEAIDNNGIKNKTYDFVTLLIGVNDQYQGISQANYKLKFATVLNTAIRFAKGDKNRVFVLSIPDYGVTPFANGQDDKISPQIDQFNAINKAISLKAGVHYLDITGISKRAATDLSLVAPDGLHPSGKMYQLWVAGLEPMVKIAFRK